jgi:ATP-binding cassette subfamily B multidrug efflux pump
MAKPPRRTTVADHMPFGPGRHGLMGSGARAKDRRGTLRRLAGCLWEHRLGLLGVAGLVALSSAFALAGPYLMSRAIDRYIKSGDLPGLARVVGLMVLLYLLTSATTWGQQVWMIRIAQRTIANLRRDLFGKLQTLSLRFFDRHPHGELMSRLTNDTDTVNAALGDTVTQFMSSIISVVGAGYIMFAMNWRLTWPPWLPSPS